jgi:hypothetical protein
MSDTFTAPIADDSPSELDVARALVPPDSADAGAEPGPYPPLAPGEEYDFSEQSESSGWIGPSPDEWETTKAAVAALAQHVLGQQSEPEWDPEPALDPLDDAFHDELAALLQQRDQFLLNLVQQQLAPIFAERQQRQLAEGEQRLAEILDAEAGGLDHDLVVSLARESILSRALDGEQVDDRAAEQALREAIQRLRGPRSARRSSPRRASVPKPPPDGDKNEQAAVARVFGTEEDR